MTKAKFLKAYKAMKKLGYASPTVKPVLKNLLEVYEKNWELIEDGDYAVLADAILNSEEEKLKESQKFHLRDEPEEDEPPLKRLRLRSQTDQALSSGGVSSPSSNQKKDKPLHYVMNPMSESDGKEKLTSSAHCSVVGSESEDLILTPLEDCNRQQQCSSPYSSSGLEKNQLCTLEESNEPDLLSSETQSDDNCNIYSSSGVPKVVNEKCTHMLKACPENVREFSPDDTLELQHPLSIVYPGHAQLLIEGDCSNAIANFSSPVRELGTEDSYGSLPAKESLHQGYYLEPKSSVAFKDKDSCLHGSHVDIASSCKGEIKLSVNFESSLPSNFRVPSLDAVLKRMEEKYLKSYNISRCDFSIVKLMNDICDTFLAAGTISTGYEITSCADHQSAPVTPGGLDSEVVLNQVTSIAGCYLDPLKFQLLNRMDLGHCNIGLSAEMSQSYWNKKLEALRNLSSSTAQSMVIVQNELVLPKMLSLAYLIDDITKGEEDFKISLTNEISDEQLPTFNYMPRSIPYKDAYVKFRLAQISHDDCCSNCVGDCLIPKIPCACATASETGGEFAYMPGGLLKEKFLEDAILLKSSSKHKNFLHCQECPLERSKHNSISGTCKGHLVRKFIKECWYKCGCTMNCGNRVVQRGIKCGLQVFMTKEKGWGLRTLEDLPRGAFLCEYVGEIVTNREWFDRNACSNGKKHTYPVLLDADWCTEGVLKDEEALCLDATVYGNVARFINHRCRDANLVEIPVEVETPDHHYYHLAFFTTREVHALEELTWDYGIDFDDHTYPVEAFHCHCDSEFCRDKRAGNVRRKS